MFRKGSPVSPPRSVFMVNDWSEISTDTFVSAMLKVGGKQLLAHEGAVGRMVVAAALFPLLGAVRSAVSWGYLRAVSGTLWPDDQARGEKSKDLLCPKTGWCWSLGWYNS